MLKILVVDDNRTSAQAMARILTKQGHEVTAVFDGHSAIDQIQESPFDLVFTDLKMEPVDGMQVLRAARARTPPLEVIVFTAFGAVEHAVEAIRLGARDFLTKPISVEQILGRVRDLTGEEAPTPGIITEVSESLRSTLEAVASVPSPVWLQGELGSGRYEAAEMLHNLSGGGPLVVFDPTKPVPKDGTLVFRNIDDYDANAQSAAQRVADNPGRLKLIATSRPEVMSKVESGELRKDLYFALAVLIVDVPPLRERAGEIRVLFQQALESFCDTFSKPVPTLGEQQLAQLEVHQWPANLRELRNLAERTAVLGKAGFNLTPKVDSPAVSTPAFFGPGFKLASHLEDVERAILVEALRQADGDRTAAGQLLGVERNTLRYKLNKYGLLKS